MLEEVLRFKQCNEECDILRADVEEYMLPYASTASVPFREMKYDDYWM